MEKLPVCHPIQGVNLQSGERGLIGILKFITGRGQRIYLRSEEIVWLTRTEKPDTFTCPRRISGKCLALFKCQPENQNIIVTDTENVTKFLQDIGKD